MNWKCKAKLEGSYEEKIYDRSNIWVEVAKKQPTLLELHKSKTSKIFEVFCFRISLEWQGFHQHQPWSTSTPPSCGLIRWDQEKNYMSSQSLDQEVEIGTCQRIWGSCILAMLQNHSDPGKRINCSNPIQISLSLRKDQLGGRFQGLEWFKGYWCLNWEYILTSICKSERAVLFLCQWIW